MDPLSDVLSLLVPRSYGAGGFDMGGEWSIHFRQHPGFKCYAVLIGQCWLSVQDVADPVLMKAGDCFLLPQGRPFRLASDLQLIPVLYSSLPRVGGIASNGGGDCFIVGGHFALDDRHAGILLGALTPIVHVRDEADRAALRWSLERMGHELRERQAGASLVAQHLSHMILVQALRLHIAEGSRTGTGWLFALADKQVSAAIAAVHNDPGHRWTLQVLAERAGMSRSGFALRFRELVGETPMDYVTRWRMLVAIDKLAASSDPVSVVGRSLGYMSESSFSTAFKRVMGRSPRQYTRKDPAPSARRADPLHGEPVRDPTVHVVRTLEHQHVTGRNALLRQI
ncbi:AraC family transcriptional regulator [Lichenicoccus sp.]|uniref:AraC family transcriptional regulator n=1 Tax=Lichenicoccus sp. TaxID=2781899 RepID=UPI003D1269DF